MRDFTKRRLKQAVAYNEKQVSPTPGEFAILTARYQAAEGLEIDGKYGPLTKADVMGYASAIEDVQEVEPPASKSERIATFGDPGRPNSPQGVNFYNANIVVVDMPGVPHRFRCHRLLEPTFREIFIRLQSECPEFVIKSAGCYNHRHMRHDSSMPLSTHSWGIAVDINPSANWYRKYPNRNGPKPFSTEWWRIWDPNDPDDGNQVVTEAVVNIFEAAGFIWGGRWTRFVDTMHFQFGK